MKGCFFCWKNSFHTKCEDDFNNFHNGKEKNVNRDRKYSKLKKRFDFLISKGSADKAISRMSREMNISQRKLQYELLRLGIASPVQINLSMKGGT